MKLLRLQGILLTSFFIYSCQITNNPNSIPSQPVVSPTPIPSLTPVPEPTIDATKCPRIGESGKNFTIKCSYSAFMYGQVKEKGTDKGIKAKIRFERENKSYSVETEDNGDFEVVNFQLAPSNLTGTKTFSFTMTVTASGYKDLIKEVTYKNDGSLEESNPLTFELEPEA